MEWTFADRFQFRIVESLEPWDIENKIAELFAGEFQGLNARNLMSDADKTKNDEFRDRLKSRFSLRIGVFDKDELIAWHFGWQDGNNDYFMTNSAVLPKYRRFGIYTELMRATLKITKEEGFQRITSIHVASNNAVLIAKLKVGFKIMGIEMMEAFGMLVRLVYYHHNTKNDLFDFRVGMKRATPQVSEYLFPK